MELLKRPKIYAEDILTEYQSGFRRGKSTMDHIFTLKKNSTNKHKDVRVLLVDFKQAYDSVDRVNRETCEANRNV